MPRAEQCNTKVQWDCARVFLLTMLQILLLSCRAGSTISSTVQ